MSDLAESIVEKNIVSWKKHVSSLTPVDFPTDYLRTNTRDRQIGYIEQTLSPELTQQLDLFARHHPWETTLVTAFQTLLNRYSQQTQIDFAYHRNECSSNQNDDGHQFLLLTTNVVTSHTFSQAIGQLEQTITRSLTQQSFPFSWAIEQLSVQSPTAEPVGLNVFLVVHPSESDSNYRLQPDQLRQAGIELSVELVVQHDELLSLQIHYRQDLFRPSTIARLLNHYAQLLRAALDQPHTPLDQLQWITQAERQLVLETFQPTSSALPDHQTVLTLFDHQVRQQPNRLALVGETGQLTYQQLDHQSRQLAAHLVSRGVTRGQFVPVVLDRSAELLITLLAIVRTGAAYVPLDEGWPADRIAFVLDDCQANLLVSRRTLADQLATCSVPVLWVDDWLAAPTVPEISLPTVDPRQLVYTIYTSGSTGVPKGVLVEHRSLLNYSYWYAQAYPVVVNGCAPLVTGVAFDVSAGEVWCNLSWGTTLHLLPDETRLHPQKLLAYYANHQITHATVPNALVYELISLPQPPDLRLRYLITGGEQLKPVDVSHLPYKLINHYGPSENTICTTEYVVQPQDIDQLPSIGKPITGTQAYVLDEFGQLLPVGLAGELYLAGRQVARGYLNRPQLTAERFLPNPFEPGERFYRTGDWVRWRSDGNLEFLNRVDHQVKIRGYRIELGEIENVLQQYPGVRQCVVVAETMEIDKRLIGYIVADSGLDTEEIKRFLHLKLPDYMVPWLLIEVEEMPLTPNGKVDKNRLPKPNLISKQNTFTGPRTPEEHLLAAIWMTVLGVEKIDIHANFFELGGSSLTAIQIVSRLEQQTGKRLPVTTIFEHPTLAQLGLRLQQNSQTMSWNTVIPIRASGTKKPLYVLSGSNLDVHLYTMLATRMDRDQPIYRLQAQGLDGIEEPLDTIDAIATRFAMAIMEHDPEGICALAGYSFDGLLAFETARQLTRLGKKTDTLIMFDSYAYQSDSFEPWSKKTVNNVRLFLKKLGHIFTVLQRDPELIIDEKRDSTKRRIYELYQQIRYGKNKKYEGIRGTIRKIDESNVLAWHKYRLTPQEIAIELFRAKRRSAYMEDFDYLGWTPFALKGITIHEVSGAHHNLFSPPHDKELAPILQRILDKLCK